MTNARALPSRGPAIASLVVFPLIGPAAVALMVAGPLALLGLLTLGPGGLLYYLFLAGWWLPGLYALFGPPFFCTGVLVALAGFTLRRSSLLLALVAAEFAFAAYFSAWYFVPGGFERFSPDYAHLQSGFFRTPWSVLAVLGGTAAGWFATRIFAQSLPVTVPDPAAAGRWSRWEAPALGGLLLIGMAGLAAVLAAFTRLPATAWKDCTEAGYEERIHGCTVIVETAEEPATRRATAYLRRGVAYEELNRGLARAISDYSDAIRLDPMLAEAYGRRGLAYASRGEDDMAVADLDTALRLDPHVLAPYTYRIFRSRGLAQIRRREFDRAIADHTEEIRLTPFYADGYLNRGAAYLAKGELDQAISDFSEAIRIEPFRPDGYIERGSVYLAQGDTDRALADFDEAIRRLPDHKLTARAYRKRGEVMERRGNLAEALAAYEKALALDPSDRGAIAGRDRMRAALAR
jgi:Tfp pilus assembly protein PilF